MARFPDGVPCRILPCAVLREFGQLLAQYGQANQASLTTDQQISHGVAHGGQFWLLQSPALTVLITSQAQARIPVPKAEQPDCCQVGLTFEVDAIAQFLQALLAEPDLPQLQQQLLQERLAHLHPCQPQALADFTLALIENLRPIADQTQVCQPVQQALDQQLEQSLLLKQVVTKIQASLDLPVLLQTTVTEVRQFLQADRLLIYQFDLKNTPETLSMASVHAGAEVDLVRGQARHGGYITYEARGSEQFPSVLHYTETYCFSDQPDCRQRYLENKASAVQNVQETYQHSPCLLAFLEKAQVQSKLVVPILVNQTLWGLLIAHQCTYERQWQPRELSFLQHIAEHLAMGISQTHLYQQLQQQTHNLETCVVERTQDLRDALAAAQSANRTKSEFLATMSHELRTPLTCIIGMSATLLRWSFGDLSNRQREYLTTIHDSGAHLLALINDILEVSKIEAGRTVLEVSEFSISSLGRQSLEAYRTEASTHEIDLHMDLKLGSDQETFVADSRRVRQILSNLLSNAIKFTPPGGRVMLRLRRDPHTLTLQVEDTGIGISESQQPLLFEKFQQLESARQRQYQGTGLGLALTKQLVDLHGGSISVTSKIGMGSIFTVRLPLQRLTHPLKLEVPQVTPKDPIVGRIVLVEDNEDCAGVICDMLTAADFQVIWVIEGSRVLEQVEVLQPSAVITSVNLADANGYDIIRSLRRYVATLDIKVLALTDGDAPDQEHMARSVGADEVLIRPIVPEQLVATITALMSVAHS